MVVKLVECLDWRAENRAGELLRLAAELGKAGVNLDALWAYTSHENEPKLAAIGKKPTQLKTALTKLGVTPNATPCFQVTGAEKAGALVGTFRTLAEAGNQCRMSGRVG